MRFLQKYIYERQTGLKQISNISPVHLLIGYSFEEGEHTVSGHG